MLMWVVEKVYDLVEYLYMMLLWRVGWILDWKNLFILILSLGSVGVWFWGLLGLDISLGGGGVVFVFLIFMVRDFEVVSLLSLIFEEFCVLEMLSLDSWILFLLFYLLKYIKNFDIKVGGYGLFFFEEMVVGLILEFLID